MHGEGVAALQGVEDGLAAWGWIARYRQRRAALLERGEAALVPICPGPLAGDGYLLDEWQSKQALKSFGLPLPRGAEHPGQAEAALGFPLVLKAVSAALPHKTEPAAWRSACATRRRWRRHCSTCAKAWPGTRRNWSSSVCCWSAWQARRWPS